MKARDIREQENIVRENMDRVKAARLNAESEATKWETMAATLRQTESALLAFAERLNWDAVAAAEREAAESQG